MSHSLSDTCTIHVHKYKRDFTVLPNSIWENSSISWAAKGLMGYLLSRPDDWQVHTWQLTEIYEGKKNGGGESAIKALIKELKEAGYITYSKSKNSKGHWIHRYDVYPEPVDKEIKNNIPQVEIPPVDNPTSENGPIIPRTELPRTELPITNTSKEDIAPTAKKRQSYDISYCFENRKFMGIIDRDISHWKELYPGCEVLVELKKMEEWAISNTNKSKTKKKWRTFINRWLEKSNEQALNKEASKASYSFGKKSTEKQEQQTGVYMNGVKIK